MEFLREWFGNMEIWWPAGDHGCFFTGPAYYQLEPWAVDVISSAITSAGLILGWKVGYYLLVGRAEAREEREEKARKEFEALPIREEAKNILDGLRRNTDFGPPWRLNGSNAVVSLLEGLLNLEIRVYGDDSMEISVENTSIQDCFNKREQSLILIEAKSVLSYLNDKADRERQATKLGKFSQLRNKKKAVGGTT